MKTNIEELKRLAEAATPGPWIKRGYVLGIGCGVDGVTAVAHHTTSADAAYIAAANPAAVLELIQQRDELLAAMHRIRSTPPAQADGGGFVVDHFDIEGEYAGSQNIDPMWVVQEMAAVASAAIAKAEG